MVMSNRAPTIERIPSGIAGLDAILGGGILAGSVQLVVGAPGTGKTILANQLAFSRAAAGHTAVYVTLLAEAHARMLAHLAPFSFFDASFVLGRIVYMSGYGVLDQGGLDGLLELLGRTIRERGATLLVLDGLGTAEEFAPTTSAFKRFLLTLSTSASMTGCTTLLLATARPDETLRPEQATVDGIISLEKTRLGSRVVREASILKMRGTSYLLGPHVFDIDTSGLHVFPRLEARPFVPPPEGSLDKRLGFGIDGLDTMLGGGIPEGTITAILGTHGTGKTLLGMSFLAEGARRGERGLYLGFREPPARVLRAADGIGLDASRFAREGLLEFVWHPATEGLIDAIAWDLSEAIAPCGLGTADRTQPSSTGCTRVFIDGLDGFRRMSTNEERMERFYTALGAELATRGATTIVTETVPPITEGVTGLERVPSAFLDNVLFVHEHVKARRLRRFVSSSKLLGGAHDVSLRRLRITSKGIEVERDRSAGRP